MRTSTIALAAMAAAAPALAQQGAWQQCGGIGWTGATTCVSGYTCTKLNDWYYQCIPGSSTTSTTLKTTTSSKSTTTSTKTTTTTSKTSSTSTTSPTSSLWWFGINLSGAEFGQDNFTGVYGKEFIWYDKSSIDTLMSKGMNMFRVNFLMERLTPNSLTASLDSGYSKNLTDCVNYITGKGAYAMIQPHNYGRFYKNIITDTAAFQTWWKNVATPFKDNQLVVFDTNNEYHDMDQQLVFDLNQAAINGIRAAGATTQYITPEGNSWSGAWTWVSSGNGASLISLNDPSDSTGSKLIFQMHQYLDSDGSGTSESCVSTTIFQERLTAATAWLKTNKKKGLLGEYAGGANSQCITALQGGLQYLKQNSDVWTGHLWWAAGPWWGTYMYSMEPPSGIAYTNVLPSLLAYAK